MFAYFAVQPAANALAALCDVIWKVRLEYG